MAVITLDEIYPISEGDTEFVPINYTNHLRSGELLSGTPTIVEVTTTDLTLTNNAVSTTVLVVKNESVTVGMAVQFNMTGQLTGILYRIRVTVSTDDGRTFVRDVRLNCV